MRVYADTNFFTALYLRDPDGKLTDPLLNRLASAKRELLPVTALLKMEVTNAIERLVFESRRGGQWRITEEAASIAQSRFHEDLNANQLLLRVPIAVDDIERTFEALSLRHTSKHGFRTYDILHVASALLLRCDAFWSFDTSALKLAKLEGLETN